MATDAKYGMPIGEFAYPVELRDAENEQIRRRREKALHPRGRHPGSGPRSGEPLPPDTIGLALSGGGIRSATFSLGMLQALARHGLLRRIDFLSTVSGGGYIGGFLGRMFTRKWVAGASSDGCVEPNTNDASAAKRREPDDEVERVTEKLCDLSSEPLDWLRQSGRYMSPNGAGDTIRTVAEYLRNWFAVQAVLASFLGLIFASANLIRAFGYAHPLGPEAIYHGLPLSIWWSPYLFLPIFALLVLAVPAGWAYWLTQRSDSWKSVWAIPPWVTTAVLAGISAVFLMVYDVPSHGTINSRLIYRMIAWLVLLCAVLTLVIWSYVRQRSRSITWMRARWERNRLSSLMALGLTISGFLLAFGLVDSLGQTVYAVLKHLEFRGHELSVWQALGAVASATGLTAVIAFGQKLALWLGKLPDRGSRKRIPMSLIAIVAGIGVALLVLVTLSTLSHAIAWQWDVPYRDPGRVAMPNVFQTGPDFLKKNQQLVLQEGEPQRKFTIRQEDVPADDMKPFRTTMSVRALAWAWILLLGLSVAFGRTFAFINLSSHQTLYGSRLTRAYLGASNPGRWSGPGQRLSDVIECDGVGMQDYRPQDAGGPLHLINVTVNETLDARSQTEIRDRKGVPMSIGPCGLSVGVRHHALWDDSDAGAAPPSSDARLAAVRVLSNWWASMRRKWTPGRPTQRLIRPLWATHQKFHALAEKKGEPGDSHPIGMPDLGTWISVSGAAFTTGLGSKTNVGLSLLLGFANVRLGYWWDSGVEPARRAGETNARGLDFIGAWLGRGFPVQFHLHDEFLARFHGTARQRWYLSDGGHFENTAVYELIRRRVPFIICCDDGADPEYTFDDLGDLVRKARLDFNAEIRFLDKAEIKKTVGETAAAHIGTLDELHPKASEREDAGDAYALRFSKAHATLASVRYEDAETAGSLILFIKPSLMGGEPQDVLNYARSHESFPQEPTADQYFDEAQWESYRKLGEHIGDRLFGTSEHGAWPWKAQA